MEETKKFSLFRLYVWFGGVVWSYNSDFRIVKSLLWPMHFGARLTEFALNTRISP